MKIIKCSTKPRPFTPKNLRGKKGAPVFTVQSLTKEEWLGIMAEGESGLPVDVLEKAAGKEGKAAEDAVREALLSRSTEEIMKMNHGNLVVSIKMCQKGVLGWEDVEDDDGEFKFSKENIVFLPEEYIEELASEVSGHLTGESEKNSEKESPSSSGSEKKKPKQGGTVEPAEKKS